METDSRESLGRVVHWYVQNRLLLNYRSGLRDGSLVGSYSFASALAFFGLELHSRAIVGSAEVYCVMDLHHDLYLSPDCLSALDSKLRWVDAIQTSLNDCLKAREIRRALVFSLSNLVVENREGSPEEPSEPSLPSYAVVVVLLSLVYQYLTGNVNTGGSKAYSRSSLDFRETFVAIVLFLGAYVWIKFREVALKGVHPRKLVDRQGGTKVVYEARLKPPMWNGEQVPRLDLGRFATPQEAHNKFLIAAFYYNRDHAGLLDGWFQVPPMSEGERSLTGREKRAWVMGQAKRVYKDFKDTEADLILQEFLEGCEVPATPGHDEGNVDHFEPSLLNSAEHEQPALGSESENSGEGLAMLDNHGLDCASHSLDGMHEGLALPNGHSLGFQERSAVPVSQLPSNTGNGMSLTGSDQLDGLQTRLGTLHQRSQEFRAQTLQLHGSDQFFLFQTRLDILEQQNSRHQQQIGELEAQILKLKHPRYIPEQQHFQDSWIQNPQWPYQIGLQQQHLGGVNQGVPGCEVEMEQSMHQHNYPGLVAPPPDGGEVQEALWDTLL